MRHLKKKKFGKGKDHRRKLLKTLASSLLLYEKIETTHANAKGVKAYAEKLITKAKENSLHIRRQLLAKLQPQAAKKALEVIGPKYKARKGGYIRLTQLVNPHLSKSKVILELVE